MQSAREAGAIHAIELMSAYYAMKVKTIASSYSNDLPGDSAFRRVIMSYLDTDIDPVHKIVFDTFANCDLPISGSNHYRPGLTEGPYLMIKVPFQAFSNHTEFLAENRKLKGGTVHEAPSIYSIIDPKVIDMVISESGGR